MKILKNITLIRMFFQYFNGRTAKNMDSVDIKVGDYLNQSEGKILIYRNDFRRRIKSRIVI